MEHSPIRLSTLSDQRFRRLTARWQKRRRPVI
jgi:hypothetical protein